MKYSYYILVIYIFALAMFSASPETTNIENLIGAILFVVFFAEGLKHRKGKFPWHTSILFLVLYFVLSFILITSQLEAVRRLITFGLVLLLFYCVFGVCKEKDTLSFLSGGLGVGLLLLVVLNFDQIVLLSQGLTMERFGGGFNANEFAYLLLVFLLLLIRPFFTSSSNKLPNIIIIILIVFAGYFIIFSGSRKGMIFLVFIAIWFTFFYLKHISFTKKVLSIGVLLIFSYTFINWVDDTPFFYRIENLYLLATGSENQVNDNSVNLRAGMLVEGLALWAEKPIFGWGFDSFRYISGFGTYSHNNYVEILVNTGFVGFALYMAFYVYLFSEVVKGLWNKKDPRVRGYLSWSLLALVLLMAWSMGAVSYTSKINWILTGIVLATIVKSREV